MRNDFIHYFSRVRRFTNMFELEYLYDLYPDRRNIPPKSDLFHDLESRGNYMKILALRNLIMVLFSHPTQKTAIFCCKNSRCYEATCQIPPCNFLTEDC